MEDKIVDLYIFPDNATLAVYLHSLRNILPKLSKDIPLEIRRNFIYREDGAPPHFSREVRNLLNVRRLAILRTIATSYGIVFNLWYILATRETLNN